MAGPFFNGSFLESGSDIIPVVNQGDVNTTLTGDWIKMTNYSRATILMAKYGSEQTDTLSLNFLQGQDAAGTGSKALNVSRYWTKVGTLTAATLWTAGVLTTPIDKLAFAADTIPTGSTRIVADATTLPILIAVDIMATDMDADGQFDWLTVTFDGTQVDNACLISVWIILHGGRFPQVANLSAIS